MTISFFVSAQTVYLISFKVVCVHMLTTSNGFTQSLTMHGLYHELNPTQMKGY